MTVYVDNAGPAYSGCPYATWWSHLWADTVAELDDFATRLGLSPVMRHNPTSPGEALPDNAATPDRPHYEVTDHERSLAILFGACTIPAAVAEPTRPGSAPSPGRDRRVDGGGVMPGRPATCRARGVSIPDSGGLDAGDLSYRRTRVRQRPAPYRYPTARVGRQPSGWTEVAG